MREILVVCVVSAVVWPASGEVRLPAILGDGMVIQQRAAAPIWGWAGRGERVTVSASWGAKAEATADESGRWRVTLSTPAAGPEAQTITVAGDTTTTIRDVLVGDVWVCGGQSNMEWPVAWSADAIATSTAATVPGIRFFIVPNVASLHPRAEQVGEAGGAWAACSPRSVWMFSAVAYHFARDVRAATGVPIGVISCDWGGSRIEPWMSPEALAGFPEMSESLARVKALADPATRASGPDGTPVEIIPTQTPTSLYFGMVRSLLPMAARGFLWYQGESNRDQAGLYARLFPAMITDWRSRFTAASEGPMPFYFVQLAPYDYENDRGETAAFREAQAAALALPATGMVVTSDIGDPADIHPRNKRDVGRRLAKLALARTYGVSMVDTGPSFAGVRFEGATATVRLDHADGLWSRFGPPLGFLVAGSDRRFVRAAAEVTEDGVRVSHPSIAAPTAVRYLWWDDAEGFLFNAAGLPAAPFRSDVWADATVDLLSPPPVLPAPRETASGEWTALIDAGLTMFKPSEGGHWRVVGGGVIEYDGGGADLWTVRAYRDFELVLDWRLPRGAVRMEREVIALDGSTATDEKGRPRTVRVLDAGDSGVYLRGNSKSQVNIWCWPAGSGEVYGYRTDGAMPAEVRASCVPRVRADRPVGEWNRFVITMRGEVLTVVLNGETVISGARLPGVPAEGPIALQHHGDPVQFANIFVRELR